MRVKALIIPEKAITIAKRQVIQSNEHFNFDTLYLRRTLTVAVTPGTSRAWQCLHVVLFILGSLRKQTNSHAILVHFKNQKYVLTSMNAHK